MTDNHEQYEYRLFLIRDESVINHHNYQKEWKKKLFHLTKLPVNAADYNRVCYEGTELSVWISLYGFVYIDFRVLWEVQVNEIY